MLRVIAVAGEPATRSCVRPTIFAPDTTTLVIAEPAHAPTAVHEKLLSRQCIGRDASSQSACSSGAARTDMLSADAPVSARVQPKQAYPLPTSMNWPSSSMRARAALRVNNRINKSGSNSQTDTAWPCVSVDTTWARHRASGVARRSCEGIAYTG